MFKTYNYQDENSINKFIILEGNLDIMDWYFDTSFKECITKLDWENAFEEVFKLVDIIYSYFDINAINVSQTYFDKGYSIESRYLVEVKQVFKDWIKEKFSAGHFVMSEGEFTLSFYGYVLLGNDVKIDSELFVVNINRLNCIGISISTNNFAFLPNHPIYRQKQYDIWKLNAPRLSKVLKIFDDYTYFDLLTEAGEFAKTVSISNDNVYYLQNSAILNYNNSDGLDEFYIPFELINESLI